MKSNQPTIVTGMLVGVAVTVGLALWFGSSSPKTAVEPDISGVVAQPKVRAENESVDSARRAVDPTANPGTYLARLAEAGTMTDSDSRRLRRAAVLGEWIEEDFRAAFRYLTDEGFESVYSLPGIAPMVAYRASVADLVTIAEKAIRPDSALLAVGRSLSSPQLVEFAAATSKVSSSRIHAVAGVVGGLLAAQNLDSALRYAGKLGETEGAPEAYAGIIGQLADTNSPDQVEEIVRALPDSIRWHDSLLFAYGNALRDVDPEEAITTLSAIGDTQYQRLALVAFSRNVEASSPPAAIQAVLLGLGVERADAHVTRILRNWSIHDAAAARSFVDAETWGSEDQRRQFLAVVEESAAGAGAP